MIYINTKTSDKYYGGCMTVYHDGVLFTGIPSVEQLEQWGYMLEVPMAAPEPTEEEIAEQQRQQRMDEIQGLLASTDYIVLKKAEGIDISEYNEQYDGDFLSWRQGLRDEYNKLEGLNNQEQ
jgi:hypothetical protein